MLVTGLLFGALLFGYGNSVHGIGARAASDYRTIIDTDVETEARVAGTHISQGKGSSRTYLVDLAWTDTQGRPRTSTVLVTDAYLRLARIADPAGVKRAKIRYNLADPNSIPVILDDIGHRQQLDYATQKFGRSLMGLGAAIAGLTLIFWWRRHRPVPLA